MHETRLSRNLLIDFHFPLGIPDLTANPNIILLAINIYIYINISKWRMTSWHYSRRTLFPFSAYQSLSNCYPQVCLGSVTMWHAHSPRPVSTPGQRAAWSPQAGTCFYHLSPRKRDGIYSPGHPRRVSPKRGCALACLAGTLSSAGFSMGGRLLGLDGRGKKNNECYFGSIPTWAKMWHSLAHLKMTHAHPVISQYIPIISLICPHCGW